MLAILTTHFNPCGYARPRANVVRFVEGLGELREHLHVAELDFGHPSPPHNLPWLDCDEQIRLAADEPAQRLWQKEALLNLLLRDVPDQYDAVAWIDADVLFRDPDWYDAACRALYRFDVVQLFTRCRHYGPDGQSLIDVRDGLVAAGGRAHGYAWAARREFLEATGGLLDWHVTGGADTFMAEAWLGQATDRRCSPAMRECYSQWMAGLPATRGVGWLPGEIFHLWHGTDGNRDYTGRTRLLIDHNFDPRRDVERDESGLLRWSGRNPDLEQAVAQYFARRREDG